MSIRKNIQQQNKHFFFFFNKQTPYLEVLNTRGIMSIRVHFDRDNSWPNFRIAQQHLEHYLFQNITSITLECSYSFFVQWSPPSISSKPSLSHSHQATTNWQWLHLTPTPPLAASSKKKKHKNKDKLLRGHVWKRPYIQQIRESKEEGHGCHFSSLKGPQNNKYLLLVTTKW